MDTGPASWPPPSGRPKYGIFAEDGEAEASPLPAPQPATPEPAPFPPPPARTPPPQAPATPEEPAPAPASSPALSPASAPIIAPSVFETKPGRGAARTRRRLGIMGYAGSALLVAIVVIAILYFWGAAIAARGA